MSNSTTPAKAKKPRPDFPLFPHASGRWAKKIRGKFVYFGKVADDPEGESALLKWLDDKDDLLAGRTPRGKREGLTVGELCDRFLQAKDAKLASGEITARTRLDYKSTTDRLVSQFKANRLVADLASDDFESLRASIATTRGPTALGNEIQRIRVIFKYGYDCGLIDVPVRFGPEFKRPSKKVMRIARAKKGPKLLEPAAIRTLIKSADVHMRAMIYLAINCGFGNSDCGTLPIESLDLDGGWLDYPRPKTGIERRCPLWPETVKALRESLAARPKAKSDDAEKLVFITKYGAGWAKASIDNPICKSFRKLLNLTAFHRAGLGFYSLRHIFRTIADEAKDQPAANAIMGHADGSMAAVYRERIGDDRLQAVSDHVRAWLFAENVDSPQGGHKHKSAVAANPTSKRVAKNATGGVSLLRVFAG